jgi:hypothetical protein
VSIRSPFSHRHDPFWEVDGPAARHARTRRKLKGLMAFGAATVAVLATAFLWTVKLGFAAAVGIRIALPIG